MTPASRTRRTLFAPPENGEAGARAVQNAPPASRIFVSFRHHFGDRCVRARAFSARLGQRLCAPVLSRRMAFVGVAFQAAATVASSALSKV